MEENIVATILGFLVIFRCLITVLYYIQLVIRILINKMFPPHYPTKYGRWAVVTGCTDGIGLAYSRELARRGFHVMLISRSEEKLKAVASKIESEFKVETKIVVADFSQGRQIYGKVDNELKNIDIGILVNNVGCGVSGLAVMENASEQLIWDLVTCNILAVTMMTKLVLPHMKRKQRGAIINISSLSGLTHTPYVALYGSTKTYVDALSKAVSYECRNDGIIVQRVYPGFVKTKMVPGFINAPAIMYPSPEKYVRGAFLTLGVTDATAGYFIHEMQSLIAFVSPLWLVNFHWLVAYKMYKGK